MLSLASARTVLSDEAACWSRIQVLRRADLSALRRDVSVRSSSAAVSRGARTVRQVLRTLLEAGLSFDDVEPAHNVGHLARDYINALRLFSKLEAAPADLFIGFLGGALHDLGCALVPRYEDAHRVVRHAEAGAILLDELFKADSFGLNRSEQLLVEYGIAAHTNYLEPMIVECSDGTTRTVEPYANTDSASHPVYGVVFPRFVDRLDCNGPTFVGRHYLSLAESHEDFSNQRFHAVEYAPHMRPLLRAADQPLPAGDGYTMLEHLNYFVNNQTNASPHGKYDYGEMTRLRNRQSARLMRIIRAVASSAHPPCDEDTVSAMWTNFLAINIEPSPAGRRVSALLAAKFAGLDRNAHAAWCNGFLAAMVEYGSWAKEVSADLAVMSSELLDLRPVVDRLADLIRPHPSWRDLLPRD